MDYIFTQIPAEFSKSEWLGIKMSPHSKMIFINKVSNDGIETSEGLKSWPQCSDQIISTIYQRLKLNEKLSK